MINIDIDRLIPAFIQTDEECHAVAKAVEAAMKYMALHVDVCTDMMWNTEIMPEWHKDELLRSLDWTPPSGTDENEKRRLLDNVYPIAKQCGTQEGIDRYMTHVMNASRAKSVIYTESGAIKGWCFVVKAQEDENDTLYNVLQHAKMIVPSCQSVVCLPGEELALKCTTRATVGGVTLDSVTECADRMSALVHAALWSVYGFLGLKMIWGGQEHTPDQFVPSTSTKNPEYKGHFSNYADLMLYEFPESYNDAEGYVTSYKIYNKSGTLMAYRNTADGSLAKNETYPFYALKWSVYVDEEAKAGSLNTNQLPMENVLKKLGSYTPSAVLFTEGGDTVNSTSCTKVYDKAEYTTAVGYQFLFEGLTDGDSVKNMMVYHDNKVVTSVTPDAIAAGIIYGDSITITFWVSLEGVGSQKLELDQTYFGSLDYAVLG